MTEEELFLAALDRPPADRAAYLDAACAGDPPLRERVEALLRSHTDPDSFLDVPAVVRQAEGEDELSHTSTLPAAGGSQIDLAPGREPGSLGRLDHYEILEVAGRGGMGQVFRARDTKLQRVVAIKVLAPHLAANGTARRRFVREAQAAAAVRDEHVVNIHAVGDGPVPYLVMEFVAGTTLARRIKERGPADVREVLRIGLQAAKGLAAAHAQGLIHRDVTPGNILLENGVERVKLSDFGLARAADDASLTREGVVAGTPLYMSPEQARGEPLDQRSDLFSLGSVLYTLCAGRPAFQASSTLAVMKRVCDDTPAPLRQVNPDTPAWLAAIIDRLTAKDPADRFQSAAELVDELGRHLAAVQQAGLTSSRQSAVAPAARPRRRWAVPAALLGVAAVLVGGAVAAREWFFPPRDDRPAGNAVPPPVEDPRVLTVSQTPEGGGRFRTITDALERVEPGMTIRILDDAVYEEHLLINRPEQFRGVVLEAVGRAKLRHRPDDTVIVWIKGVPEFTLRGLRFESLPGEARGQVHVTGACPGVVLDRLDMTAAPDNSCIRVFDAALPRTAAPVVIQRCTMRNCFHGVYVRGLAPADRDKPRPSGHVVVRDNTMVRVQQAVFLLGAVTRVHVVGNRITDSKFAAIDLFDLLPGAEDVLVANNTLLRNLLALRIWDDHAKGKDFLKCKNVRFQNNLVIGPQGAVDLIFTDHARGVFRGKVKPGDVASLRKSPEWRFSHNWREIDPDKTRLHTLYEKWIPAGPADRLQPGIAAGSRRPGDPDFLRPPKDSPLATAGAGRSDPAPPSVGAVVHGGAAELFARLAGDRALPPFVGAVPPEGVEPWDWDSTWKALTR